MQLDGTIPTTCPPEQVVALLLEPDALRKLMPAGCEVGQRQGDSLPFVIRRKVGPIKLSMSGSLTLAPSADGTGHDLTILASHVVAGRAKVSLALTADSQTGRAKRLMWKGQLETSGLASRVVEGRGKRVRWMVESMFLGLRDQVEWA